MIPSLRAFEARGLGVENDALEGVFGRGNGAIARGTSFVRMR